MHETKQCEGCLELKSIKDDFYTYPSITGPKPRNLCKSCSIKRSRATYAKDRDRLIKKQLERYREEIAKNPHANAQRKLKSKLRKHGATLEWYERQREIQSDLCAICGNPEKSRGTRKHFDVGKSRLAIDHDHRTNKVRGLLCMECNNRLAALEMHDWLRKAMAYLAQY